MIDIPPGAIVGVVGIEEAAITGLVREAAGRVITARDALDFGQEPSLFLEYALDARDVLTKMRVEGTLLGLRRAGRSIVIATHDLAFLERVADEVWWVKDSGAAERGHPATVLDRFRRHLIRVLRENTPSEEVTPTIRRGDGRARLIALETLDTQGRERTVYDSGETAIVRVVVRFEAAVADPVVGMMIRTQLGLDVYGTNTEAEKLKLGPCVPGDVHEVVFTFRCDLCAKRYTLTAASHDPDGVWHDWLEDAIAFEVADTRYTAGVANLRASVRSRKLLAVENEGGGQP
jgi:hypothetical protein